jgi:uncharacterized protein YrrD
MMLAGGDEMNLNFKERMINVVFNDSVELEENFMGEVFLDSLKRNNLKPFWINLDYLSSDNRLAEKIKQNVIGDLEDNIIFQDYYKKNECPENNDKNFLQNLSEEFAAISSLKLNNSYDLLIISGTDFYNKKGFNKSKFYNLARLLGHFIKKYKLKVVLNVFVPKNKLKHDQLYKETTALFNDFSFLFNEKRVYSEGRLYNFKYIKEIKNKRVLYNLEFENKSIKPSTYNIYSWEIDKHDSYRTTTITNINDLFFQIKLMKIKNIKHPFFLIKNNKKNELKNKINFKEKNALFLVGNNKVAKKNFIKELIFNGLKNWEIDVQDIGYVNFNKEVGKYHNAQKNRDEIRNKYFHSWEMSDKDNKKYSKNQKIINDIDEQLNKKVLIVENINKKNVFNNECFLAYNLIKYRLKDYRTTFLLSEISFKDLEDQMKDKDCKETLNYWSGGFTILIANKTT